ncbi:hypothetical protein [Nesterenkonia xinjiangensis]|uniref:Uncharacterized protein n=1 Tax=Nesterenkonia xinjiangensis TaxID=225327 RepID=A0A7Z0GJH8_9MICC|nr:hypothetical protein [Nesterenkonia xinjiangensis]NYJ77082.1 hypothetical protein [Nesterenkonia xinjiangensis]
MHPFPALTNWWPGGGGGDAPDLRPGLEESDISPGIEGFLFTALIVVLLIFVVRDLAKRMRRMKYRTQVEAELAGEEPEFPGEVVPAEISEAQRHARDAAAAERFGPAAEAPPESSAEDPEAQSAEPDEERPGTDAVR